MHILSHSRLEHFLCHWTCARMSTIIIIKKNNTALVWECQLMSVPVELCDLHNFWYSWNQFRRELYIELIFWLWADVYNQKGTHDKLSDRFPSLMWNSFLAEVLLPPFCLFSLLSVQKHLDWRYKNNHWDVVFHWNFNWQNYEEDRYHFFHRLPSHRPSCCFN